MGVVVGESLGSFTTADAAQSVVAGAQHAATTCTSFGAGGTRLTIAPLTLPNIGDFSFAVRLSHRTADTDVVLAEVGSTVLLLGWRRRARPANRRDPAREAHCATYQSSRTGQHPAR
jgi:hypothetical protein